MHVSRLDPMRGFLSLVQRAGLLLSLHVQAQGLPKTFTNNNDPETIEYGPFTSFRTEPTFFYHTPNITIQLQDTEDAAHYLFYGPRTLFARQFGPHIIDQRDGSLVWYGNESLPGSGTMGVEPCYFDGNSSRMLNSTLSSNEPMKHLCINQVVHVSIHDSRTGLPASRYFGLSLVLDHKYEIVFVAGEKEAAKEMDSLINPASTILQWEGDHEHAGPHEPHDFHTLPDGKSYVTLVAWPRTWNLRPYAPAPTTHDEMLELRYGNVIDACFQDIPITSSNRRVPTFSWCALDAYPDIDFWRPHVFFNREGTKSYEPDGRYRDGAGGRGNEAWGWDLFHLNSIDLDDEGNYLVSARHLDTVFLIAGLNSTTVNPKTGLVWLPGQLIWRLNGVDGGDFDMIDATSETSMATRPAEGEVKRDIKREWGFGRQHHARYLASMSNDTHMAISLFDNGWTDRLQLHGNVSSGLVIALTRSRDYDSARMKATLLGSYQHPYARGAGVWHAEAETAVDEFAQSQDSGGGVSVAEGSAQVLPSGNMLVGWGSVPEVTEFNHAGDPIWHMHFGPPQRFGELLSYRVAKAEWVGEPATAPKLVVFGTSCGSASTDNTDAAASIDYTAYVSWNGATEVATWKFFVKIDQEEPETILDERSSFLSWSLNGWIEAGSVPKQGFETSFRFAANEMSQAPTGVFVEALDVNDRVLAISDPVRVFVPLARLVAEGRCDKMGCTCENDDLEGCTTNGPTKHFIYSSELSEECSTQPLTPPSYEYEPLQEDETTLKNAVLQVDEPVHNGSFWTKNNTGWQPTKGKFALTLWVPVALLAAVLTFAKMLGISRATAFLNVKLFLFRAKASVFILLKAIMAAWQAQRNNYHSISLEDVG